MGNRSVSLYSVAVLLAKTNLIPLPAFFDVLKKSKLGKKVDLAKLSGLFSE